MKFPSMGMVRSVSSDIGKVLGMFLIGEVGVGLGYFSSFFLKNFVAIPFSLPGKHVTPPSQTKQKPVTLP